MRTEFLIHIGLPKTATTTIQRFLTTHRDALLRRGVLYPKSIAISDGHSELHRVLGLAVDPESTPWLAELGTQFDIKQVIPSLFGETVRSEAKVVILSSEALAFMRRPEALRSALAPYPVRILVYLRRQDCLLASLYNQFVKSGLYAATFEEYLRQHRDNAVALRGNLRSLSMCDYDRLLDLWASAFGQKNILAGVFEDYDLPAGILQDVALKTGIDVTGLSPPEADTNPALPLSVLSLKRRVNTLLSTNDERITAELAFATQMADDAVTPSGDDVKSCIERRRTILARYQEGNDRVARKYFGGRPSLFDAPDEHDSPLPDWRERDWEDPARNRAVQIIAGLVTKAATAETSGR